MGTHFSVQVPVDERAPWQRNVCPGIINVPGRTQVVINNSQLDVISAAAKACTFGVVAFREWIGRLSDRYLIGTNTWYIVSNRIGYFCIRENPILCASLQVGSC